MSCPDVGELERYCSGNLDDERSRVVSDHIESCAECPSRLTDVQDNLGIIGSIRGAVRGVAATEAPVPEAVAGYAVEQELGRGGMGVVYQARQRDPARRVALKVLHPPYAIDPEYARMFRREIDALARLHHPNIAAIFEAGQSEDGRPFFAMEYVSGRPIVTFCEAVGLDTRGRLLLFRQVCDAIAFAHQRGVLHRDLKPSNVLVDESGMVKVLDFGLARICDVEEPGAARTQAGRVFGTIPYMSPEQIRGDVEAVDVRSDVYALGVVLYELLTGRLPYPVSQARLPEAMRVICEDPPVPPHTIVPALRGDLDTVLLTALEKDPERRYASAAHLRDEIDLFLANRPITARAPSLAYQLGKLIKRHKLPFALAGLTLGLIIAFGITAGVMAVHIANERAVAIEAKEREADARRAAERDASRFEAISTYLEEMLTAADPVVAPGGSDTTVRDILDRAGLEIESGAFSDQPEVEVAVRTTLGNVYRSLGNFPSARPHLEAAVQLERQLHPEGSEQLAYSLNKLGRLLQAVGDYEEAERAFREALAIRRRLLGQEHPDVATMLNNLGWLRQVRGDMQAAERLHREALAIRRRSFGAESEFVANSLNNLANCLFEMDRYEEAEAMFRESLDMDRRLRGPGHPHVLMTTNNLAIVLQRRGRAEEAESLIRETLAELTRLYGARHPEIAKALSNLGQLLNQRGALTEAETVFRQSLAMARALRGPRHLDVATTLSNMAAVMTKLGRPEEAERLAREAYDIRSEVLGPGDSRTLDALHQIGDILMHAGSFDRAEAVFEKVLANIGPGVSPRRGTTYLALQSRATCLVQLGKPAEAKALLVRAYGMLDRTDPRGRDGSVSLAERIASLCDMLGETEDTARWRRELRRIAGSALGDPVGAGGPEP